MICRFKTRWYVNGELDNHYAESGYVAGESYDECFSKVRDWYFSDQTDEMESIEISVAPCVDDEFDILVTDSGALEDISAVYEYSDD